MIIFDQSMKFLKGNTHLHTTNSDGKLSPEAAADLYRAQDYDFVVQTDHWKLAQERVQDGMLVVPGIEYDVYPPNQTAHIVAVGVKKNLKDEGFSKQSDAQGIIDAINTDGGCAILAHPAWSLNTPQFIMSLQGVAATEIYNTCSGLPWNAERADSSGILDVTAANGCLIPLVAADDSHFYKGEHCRSYIMLQAEKCETGAIVDALKADRFYATQGPRFTHVEVTPTQLIIRCTPAKSIVFYSNLNWVTGRCRFGDGLTESVYDFNLERGESFVRVEITDEDGNKAWLSPMKIEY